MKGITKVLIWIFGFITSYYVLVSVILGGAKLLSLLIGVDSAWNYVSSCNILATLIMVWVTIFKYHS